MDDPKTKEMLKVLANIKAARKALIITDIKDENVIKSASNIPGVKTTMVGRNVCVRYRKSYQPHRHQGRSE